MIRYQFNKVTFVFLVLTFTAIIASSIILSSEVMGVYNLYNIVEELGNKNSVIVSGYSISPYTSLINKNSLINKLNNISGVKKITFIIFSLGYVNGKDVAFIGINNFSNPYCAYPGYYVKEELKLKLNQDIVVYPALSNLPLVLKVCNFSNSYPWAVQVSIDTAYQIHGGGINTGLASLAIIELKNQTYKNNVMSALNLPPLQKSLLNSVSLIIQSYGVNGIQKDYQEASQAYFDKLGIPRIAFLSLSISLIALISIASYISGYIFALIDKERIVVLRNYGVSKRKILANILLINYFSITISIGISIAIFYLIKGIISSELLGLPLIPNANSLIIISALILTSVISTISILINLGGEIE